MELPFTHRPGRRERHLRRRHGNPLFGWPPPEVSPETLLAAQKADHDEMLAFQEDFRTLVQRAMDLPADAGSDAVLALKQDLERAYEQTHGLPEDHRRERDALRRLVDLIMKAVSRAAGSDPLAQQELGDETAARAVHYQLLEQPLVADLLHPESPIDQDALAPSVLSAGSDEVAAVIGMLEPSEIADLVANCESLLGGLEPLGLALEQAHRNLALLRSGLAAGPGPRH